MKRWVDNLMTACHFAASLSKKDLIAFVELTDISPEFLNLLLDDFGLRSRFVVLVFPNCISEENIIDVLGGLTANQRWSVSVVLEEDDKSYIKLEWITAGGYPSSCMGLAPLFTMPVTRRSPYMGIALWPGPPGKEEQEEVGLIDTPTPHMDKGQRRKTFRTTEGLVKKFFDSDDEMVFWREVSFCLRRDLTAPILHRGESKA